MSAEEPRVPVAGFGTPRVHYARTDSTNLRARRLATVGAPHGTLVTAAEQQAGRGRQGRTWSAPPGSSVLMSVILRPPGPLVPLAAGIAVAEVAEAFAAEPVAVKWPNDVWVGGRKVAGILVEGRPQDGWAVLGIGLNVAIPTDSFPEDLRQRATSLGLEPGAVEAVLARLLLALERWTAVPDVDVLAALRPRDALAGRRISWREGTGIAAGIDDAGRLMVETAEGPVALDAGEVHLQLTSG